MNTVCRARGYGTCSRCRPLPFALVFAPFPRTRDPCRRALLDDTAQGICVPATSADPATKAPVCTVLTGCKCDTGAASLVPLQLQVNAVVHVRADEAQR